MATQRHKISLLMLKNVSRMRPPFELFYVKFKDTNAAQRYFVFVDCYVVKLISRVARLSRTFSTFLDYS